MGHYDSIRGIIPTLRDADYAPKVILALSQVVDAANELYAGSMTEGSIPESRLDNVNAPSAGAIYSFDGSSGKPIWLPKISLGQMNIGGTPTTAGEVAHYDPSSGQLRFDKITTGQVSDAAITPIKMSAPIPAPDSTRYLFQMNADRSVSWVNSLSLSFVADHSIPHTKIDYVGTPYPGWYLKFASDGQGGVVLIVSPNANTEDTGMMRHTATSPYMYGAEWKDFYLPNYSLIGKIMDNGSLVDLTASSPISIIENKLQIFMSANFS